MRIHYTETKIFCPKCGHVFSTTNDLWKVVLVICTCIISIPVLISYAILNNFVYGEPEIPKVGDPYRTCPKCGARLKTGRVPENELSRIERLNYEYELYFKTSYFFGGVALLCFVVFFIGLFHFDHTVLYFLYACLACLFIVACIAVSYNVQKNKLTPKADSESETDSVPIERDLNFNIRRIKSQQKSLVTIIACIAIFFALFFIGTGALKTQLLPHKALTVKLTTLDYTQKSYYKYDSSEYYYLYTKTDEQIKLYKFRNASMYSSKNVVQSGRATGAQLKQYFSKNLHSGTPPLSYCLPWFKPITIILVAACIGTIVFQFLNLRKNISEAMFLLFKNDEKFISLQQRKDKQAISPAEFKRQKKELFSNAILKNNSFYSLFKFLY